MTLARTSRQASSKLSSRQHRSRAPHHEVFALVDTHACRTFNGLWRERLRAQIRQIDKGSCGSCVQKCIGAQLSLNWTWTGKFLCSGALNNGVRASAPRVPSRLSKTSPLPVSLRHTVAATMIRDVSSRRRPCRSSTPWRARRLTGKLLAIGVGSR
jgi:hypothetical protein